MPEMVGFDREKIGALPAGWIAGVTGRGAQQWVVIVDPKAPSPPHVLQQSGSGTFPWCVKKDASLADGFVEVKFKPISGREDQAGGGGGRRGGRRLALEGRRQLLRRPRERAREQRLALLHEPGQAQHARVCRCADAVRR